MILGWERAVAAGADSTEEYRFLKTDGSASRVETHVTAMRDDAGTADRLGRDVPRPDGRPDRGGHGHPRDRPVQGRVRQRADRYGPRHARGNLAPGQRGLLPAARLLRGGAARAQARRAHGAGRRERSGGRGRRDAPRDAVPPGRRHPDLGRHLDDPRAQPRRASRSTTSFRSRTSATASRPSASSGGLPTTTR